MYAGQARSYSLIPFSSTRWLALVLVLALLVGSLPLRGGAPFNTAIPDAAAPALPLNMPAAPASSPAAPAADVRDGAAAFPDMSSLPLAFVPNVGQTDEVVEFHARALGGTVYFTSDEIVLSLPTRAPHLAASSDDQRASTVVRLHFQGAESNPVVTGGEQLDSYTNYIRGANPANWKTYVPNYAGITYEQIYPGIDLKYDGKAGTLKGTYLVAPHVNPNIIRWNYAGAQGVHVNPTTGDLHVALQGTSMPLVEQAPIAWQTINGQRVPVAASYALADDGTVGFALGNYNPSYALTIDPALMYSTYLGSTDGTSEGTDIAINQSEGSAYIVGTTDATNFPTENRLPGGYGDNKNEDDVFITKLELKDNQTVLAFSTYLGGDGSDEGNAIALDDEYNIYITGTTNSDYDETDAEDGNLTSSFPISPTAANTQTNRMAYQIERAGARDAFVARLLKDGAGLDYCTFLGGSDDDLGKDIVIYNGGDNYDNQGTIYYEDGKTYSFAYVVGQTASDDLGDQSGGRINAVQPDFQGVQDGFVAKLAPNGQSVQFLTYLGGNGTDSANGIAVDSGGRPYITGNTTSANFYQLLKPSMMLNDTNYITHTGESDIFVTRLETPDYFSQGLMDGTRFFRYLGGNGNDTGNSIALDEDDNIYLTGSTNGLGTIADDTPLITATLEMTRTYDGRTHKGGGDDAFVLKMNPTATDISYASHLGGNASDTGNSIDVDSEGNAYIVGTTGSSNFPTYQPPPNTGRSAGTDAFITVVNSAGDNFVYSTFIGGSGDDEGRGVQVYGAGDTSYTFITGKTSSNNFPLQDPYQDSSSGTSAFISKIGPPTLQVEGDVTARLQADVGEPTGEATALEIALELNAPSSTLTTIDIETSSCGDEISEFYRAFGSDGTEINPDMWDGADYLAMDEQRSVPAGTTALSGTETSAIAVTIQPDNVDETNEQFCLNLTTGFKETRRMTITIVDNDGPTVSVSPRDREVREEGPGGNTKEAYFDVRLLPAAPNAQRALAAYYSPQPVEVPIELAPENSTRTLGYGLLDTDFTSTDVTNIVITSTIATGGQLSAPYTVTILPDNERIKERDEAIVALLGQPSNEILEGYNTDEYPRATLADTSMTTMTIVDNYASSTKALLRFIETGVYTISENAQPLPSQDEPGAKILLEIDPSSQDNGPLLFGAPVSISMAAGPDSTATEGEDYTFNNPQVWPAETPSFEYTIPVTNDLVLDPEFIRLQLNIAEEDTDIAEVIPPGEAILNITDEARIYLPRLRVD